MNRQELIEIGTELESISFPRLSNGKAQIVPFAHGSWDEVAPIIDGVAESHNMFVAVIEHIAVGVRMAADINRRFPGSGMNFQGLLQAIGSLTPADWSRMESVVNPSTQVYVLI